MALDDQQLFERFRGSGEVAALGELFDRVAPTLLRIALHLARDPAAAEDLLQSTFLRAIEVRDEWDGQRPLLPWLCGLLQNRARHDRWQGGRVPDPARLAVPVPVDPAQAAQCAEFDAAVDAAIAGLSEVYRPVMRLHLAYGHQPAEIAHALERPPGTVRSQLARGLELLRKLLPAGFAGAVALTLASGRGLAAVKQVVLGHAVVAAPAVVAGAIVGGVAMMKKLVMVVAVVVFAAGAWFAWPSPKAAVPPGTAVDAAAPAGSAAVLRAATPDVVAPSPTERIAPVPPTPAATTGALRITCRWGDDGSPAWGVFVQVTPSALRDGALLQRTVQTGDDGNVLIADAPIGRTWLEADRGGTLGVEVAAGITTDAALVIPPGINVRGRVVDDIGAPVPAAQVWLSEERRNYCDGAFVAVADHAGQFFLRSVEPERFLSATSPGRRGAGVQAVRGTVGTTIDLELVLRGAGATLFGKVVGPDGAPAADARVFVGWRDRHSSLSPDLLGPLRPPLALRTAADGTFAAHGLEAGSSQAVWVRAPGCCAWSKRVQLETVGNTSVVVQLETGGVLAGRATDVAGKPVPGAWIDYRSSSWVTGRAEFHEGREPEWSHSHAQTDADGRYRIDCITPGVLRLRATKDDLEVRGEVAVGGGQTAIWDPVLVPIEIRGRVVDERGAPLVGVDVTAMPPRGQGNMGSETTDADGRFVCKKLSMVPHVLTFHAPGDRSRVRPAAMCYGVQPGAGELLVRMLDAAIPKSTIVGRLLDADGRPPAKAYVRGSTAIMHGSVEVEVDAATGQFRLGHLPAGTWRLQGSVVGSGEYRRSAWSEPFLLAVGETRDIGVMQMPATGSIVVTAIGPDGAPLDKGAVVLEDSTGWSDHPWLVGALDRGSLRIDRVAPGDYRIRIDTRDLPGCYTPVTVAAGQQASIEARVLKGVAVNLVLAPISEPVPMHLWFEWSLDGAHYQRYENRWEDNAERTWPMRMLPGSYEVTITSETGKCETNRFVIGADDPEGRAIPIKLP